jgi:excisionase family DNA binding protein
VTNRRPSLEDEPLLLNPREFATRVGLGRDATYALLREGRIRHLCVGRRILIPAVEAADFVEREVARNDEVRGA